MNTGIVIAAGGVGKRMGEDKPKQFLEFSGKPMISHTLDRFYSAGMLKLVVSVPEDSKEQIDTILKSYPPTWKSVIGGERRQDSVLNGINALEDVEAVLVHDAARPFIRPALIKKSALALNEHDGVLVALPARDTIKEVENHFVSKTIPREKIWQAQTPQGGKTEILKKALSEVGDITDDAMALESIGVKPFLIEGDPWNIKITTKEDLVLATAIAERIKKDADWHRL